MTPAEENIPFGRVLSLDERGLSPTLPFVRRMANLLQERMPDALTGQHWVAPFVNRHEDLKSKFSRKYDYQRAECEEPEILRGWFDRVKATVEKYGILADDIYNFDETGFQMGVISTATRVVTRAKPPKSQKGRPKVRQPGNRNWVTAIEGVSATGWALPATVIFEGKVHLSSWYRTGIPED